MTTGNSASDYEDRTTQATLAVMIEIGQALGSFRDAYVVIGGSVPWLLFRQSDPLHVGTMDVDLCLDAEALGGGRYATLVEALAKSGFERNPSKMRPFQLRRVVPIDEGPPVTVMVDLLMPRAAKFTKNRPRLVEGLRVIEADGAALALLDAVEVPLSGAMPDGRQNLVRMRVASVPALLVMKGYALVGRDKKKDAYDIYFVVRQYEGGPTALAKACRHLLSIAEAAQAFQHIAEKFVTRDAFGPQTVRAFIGESGAGGGLTPDQVQTDAFEQLDLLIRALGLR